MSKRPHGQGRSGGEPAASMSFEAAMSEVESIIERIESGEVGLEESLAQYERGVALVRRCREILAATEQRIRDLTEQMQREPATGEATGRTRGRRAAGDGDAETPD